MRLSAAQCAEAVRGRRAFARTERTVDSVHAAGLSWGAIFTLTRSNLIELPEVVRFAATHGARFVQVHGLNAAGRAAILHAGDVPDEIELAAATTVACLAGQQDAIPVLVDIATAADCMKFPSLAVPLPDIVIIDPDGNAVPMHHDIHPRYRLGRITDASLAALLDKWHADGRATELVALEHAARRMLDEPGAAGVAGLRRRPESPAIRAAVGGRT